MVVLQTSQLTKKYGRLTAVDSLDLKLESGQVYGLLGPNGSGKTTTLAMILGVTIPDSGSFTWFGNHDPYVRRRIGSILETPNFYTYLNGVENLKLVAHIKRSDRREFQDLLEMAGLWDRRTTPFSQYSLGMKQRLAIAATLISDPEVLIFDEPTNGLDPQGIADVRSMILRIAQTGKTILMASHILAEVEKICSHVGILKNGKLLASGAVGAILNQDQYLEIGSKSMEQLRSFLEAVPGIHNLNESDGYFIALIPDSLSAEELNRLAFEKGILLNRLILKRKSLESEFLEIIKSS